VYEKIYNHRYSIIFVILIIAISAWYLFGSESGGTTGNNNDVQGTVHGIMGDNRESGKSIDQAVEHIGAAEKELERANEANQRAGHILSEGKERVDAGSGIVRELQQDNSRAKQILRDIELANKKRTKEK
jgi:hypothetical protein